MLACVVLCSSLQATIACACPQMKSTGTELQAMRLDAVLHDYAEVMVAEQVR